MSPFVQELISIISMLAGVVVLTSWVMWILFRPSGDTKVKDFAQESAKDGLTRCVMENNELKNVVKRLERENKVLMSAGYGHKSESSVEKDEKAEQGKGERTEEESVGANSFAQESSIIKDEVEEQVKGERLKVKGEELKTKEPAARKPPEQEAEPTLNKITDEAEKKKIADYMASVEKATERQKEEIKKVQSWKQSESYGDDDLKKIRGIGPHIEKMLKKAGVTSYQQISEFNEQDIRLISDAIGSFPRRINREQWVEQAEKLVRSQKP